MTQDLNWFQKKWGLVNPPIEELYQKVVQLENRVRILEEENVELTNELYRLENSLDARIDILTLENWKNEDV
jgi:hypothetical protein